MIPDNIGTLVLLTRSNGFTLIKPATMTVTAATGDTALIRLPANAIGTDIAVALIPAAIASGIINGTIA